MTNEKTSPGMRITHYLPLAEKAFLFTIAVGLILHYSNINSRMLLIVSLGGLAIVFFLYMNKLIEIEKEEGKQFGFSELLGWVILPKVLWIGTSVSTAGIIFYYMHLKNHGYFTMSGVGGSTIFIAILVLCLLYFMGVKQLDKVVPILYRAVPALLISFYIFFMIG